MNILNLDYADYSPQSRVWMYMADQQLTQEQAMELSEQASLFCDNWKSHGQPIKATSLVLEDQILIFLVEEDEGVVGGCSIDSSVNFVKELGASFKVDFFNRMLCAYVSDESICVVPTAQLNNLYQSGELKEDSLVINSLIKNRLDLEKDLFLPFNKSWYSRFIKQAAC